MPKISVIIPAYNSEETIAKTIQSVLNQTLANFELIVINDGSQDSTLDIVTKFTDSRIKVFSYPNQGVSASRNRGLNHAVGEFITFLDADDIWTRDKLEMQLQALEDNPEAKIAYSWTDYINENDEFILSGSHTTFNGDIYEKLLINNFLDSGSNPLIYKQALIEVGEFDQSVTPAEDWDMWLRLADKFKFVAVPKVQILYRFRANSGSSNLNKQEKVCLEVLRRGYTALEHQKKEIWDISHSNLYKYLTCKALQQPFTRKKGWNAAKFLWKYFAYNPSKLKSMNFSLKLFAKSALIILSPYVSFNILTNRKFSKLSFVWRMKA